MISSFFSKTKPITYVVLLLFLTAFYFLLQFLENHLSLSSKNLWPQLLAILALILSVFVIDDMVKREKITGQSSFAILFFVLLMLVFPQTLLENEMVWANLFVLLSIKKLLEAKEAKNLKHKIFDATLFLCVSSLFHKWTVLYFILVLFSLNTYGGKNAKNWMAPLMGVLAFLIVAIAMLLLSDNEGFLSEHYNFAEFGIANLEALSILSLKKILFLVLMVGFAIFDLIKYRKKGGGKLIMMRMLLLYFVLVVPVLVLTEETTNPILLAFFPAAVFLGNYMETIKRKRLKELVLIFFIALPIFMFLIESQA